jgi:glycosyltransferase involved in cell wall biosynthesis
MKLAIFGLCGSFDYHHIGGMDSIVRRLGRELVRRGEEVDFVHFGAPQENEEDTPEGIRLRYCRTFKDGLRALAGHYDNVLTIYVRPRQRLAFARFRQREAKRIRFHHLYAGWSESQLKRELLFSESRLAPYNGYLFCVSPRQQRYVSKWSNRTMLLLPAVPEGYFLKPEEKSRHEPVRVVYMGRVDPGKGTPAAVALFKHLERGTEFETRIYGYPWKHKPETVQLHEYLLAQDDILYEPTESRGYSPAKGARVHRILRETDVLYLPYDKLSSTIDTPLLLLEGMAHLCAVVTRPLGDMVEIYGTDQWMLDDLRDHRRVERLLRKLGERLTDERERLAERNQELRYSVRDVADQFYAALRAA